jgi:predicted permease
MMGLLITILPVFVIVGAGYLAVWRGLFADSAVDGLMVFTQKFALPCLLFFGIATLDLGQNFDWRLLISYYTGSLSCFSLGLLGARMIFGRPWTDSVAIGFCALFTNGVLLGLPIMERAYGPAALASNFAIIAIHAPFCYLLGITCMEIARAQTRNPAALIGQVGRAMFSNSLMIGIAFGFVVNLSGLTLPSVIQEALNLMIQAALPAALFGLGGVLFRYKPQGDAWVIAMICGLSLCVHPMIAWAMGTQITALSVDQLRSAVMMAAMAPGINSYIFADMYGCARRVAATSVLVATAISVITAATWIAVLP